LKLWSRQPNPDLLQTDCSPHANLPQRLAFFLFFKGMADFSQLANIGQISGCK
jgi:hypothetical protein